MSFLPTDLIGVQFIGTKRPLFNTEVADGDGGKSRRNAIQVNRVRWYFKLSYEFIYKQPPGSDEMFAFFASLNGPTVPFLYRDPTDNFVTTNFGTFLPTVADGTATTVYQLARIVSPAYAAFVEMVTEGPWNATFGTDTYQPYVNGVPVPGGQWATNPTGGVTFSAGVAPAGSILAWAGNFYFRLRFKGDAKSGLVGSKFMNNYWQHTIELQSALRGTPPVVVPPGPGLTFIDDVPNVDAP